MTDTNSVDMHLTGAGTTASPYVFSADVIKDPEATNLLSIGPAGLDVPCEAVQDCVGNGFTEGLLYDDAANQFKARIDPAPGNTIAQSAAGLFAAGAAAGTVHVTSTPCVTLAGDGTTGTPLSATLNTAPWPYACPDTNGQPVVCATDGKLRGAPPIRTVNAYLPGAATQTIDVSAIPCGVPTVIGTGTTAAMTITNPDPCRSMEVILEISGRYRLDLDRTAVLTGSPTYTGFLFGQYQVNGGGFLPFSQTSYTQTGTFISVAGTSQLLPPAPITLAPGASAVIDLRQQYVCAGTNPGAEAVINPGGIRALGVSTD